MEPTVILGFAMACVVLNLLPGPGMMFIIAHGIAGGRQAGVISALGMASGTAVHTVAAALGLSALLNAAPAVLDIVRIAGAIFLLYLAINALRSTRQSAATTRTRPRHSRSRTYVSAVLTNLANPKVILFYLAFVPQFITSDGWPTAIQILVLGTVLVMLGLLMDSAVGITAGTFSAFLLRRPSIQHWIKRLSAAIFGGLALRQLLSDSR
jgi:threonine/homoserine/homoserine lactone efflux protein